MTERVGFGWKSGGVAVGLWSKIVDVEEFRAPPVHNAGVLGPVVPVLHRET